MAKQANNSRNLLYIFAYLLTWLSGLIMYITVGQTDKRMKFHSLQAIMLGIVGFVLAYLPVINIVWILAWLYGMYVGWQAYEGNDIEMPVLGDFARQYAK